jgi:hypothetical protein
MQPADDVQFSDPEAQRFAGFLDDCFDAELKAVRVPFFARERAELAAQDAVIGVINVPINDITGAIGG